MTPRSKRNQEENSRKPQVVCAYALFVEAEKQGRMLCLEDIQCATGYRKGTTEIYVKKKWWWFLDPCLGQRGKEIYRVKGLQQYSFEEFLDLHRQKREPKARADPGGSPWERYLLTELPEEMAQWLLLWAKHKNCQVGEIVTESLALYRTCCGQESLGD